MPGTLTGLALTLVGIVVIFGSVLIHELAHAMLARRYDIPVARIDIHMFGGTVQFGWRPQRLSRDVALTFAGPASNLVLAAVSGLLLLFVLEPHMVKDGCEWMQQGYEEPGFAGRALFFGMYINLGLGLVNLLPAFPLDGGWIAYRVLTYRFGARKAGIVVGALGVALASVSTLVFVGSILSGFAIYAPPNFRSNLEALRTAQRGDSILI
jgi:Zn-dependent protease